MDVYLNVRYEDKDEIKSLGGKWNPYKKQWYITSPEDLSVFSKWMSEKDKKFFEENKEFMKEESQRKKKWDAGDRDIQNAPRSIIGH